MIKYDVVIVGGGIIGLSLALSLYDNGLNVTIIDSNSLDSYDLNNGRIETKVSAINHKSKELLKILQVWNSIKNNRISTYYNVQVWDDDIANSININSEEIAEHSLGNIIENELIIQTLLQRIQNTDIKILGSQKIYKIERNYKTVSIKLDNNTIETSLVIGADGANSFIRDYFNFETSIKSYHHTAIVATIELDQSHQQTVYQRFYDKGILAFLPLQDNRCSIVWSLKDHYAKYVFSLSNKIFEQKLSEAIGIYSKIKLLSGIFQFPLVERHAKEYIQENVVLIGDACHSIHPLAGQGVNLGFKDVMSLSKVLSRAFNKNRMLGDTSTLGKYQRQRKLDNFKMILLVKLLKEVFASENQYLTSLRRLGFQFVDKNNLLKSLLVKQVL